MQTLIVAPGKSVSPGVGPIGVALPGVGPGGTVTVSDSDAAWLTANGYCLKPGSNVASLGIAGGAVDVNGNPIGGGGHL